MKKAKAVILSSSSEGFGCVLIEALYCTKGVVISSDCPDGPREILQNGRFGKLFEVGNAQALAHLMRGITAQKIKREMFTKGLKKHLQKFSFKGKKQELVNLLESPNLHIKE